MSMRTNQQLHRTVSVLSVVALLALLTACRGTTSSKPPVHLNPNMDNVARVEAQEPSDFWDDGRGMRMPVEGTVAQGELRQRPWFDDGRRTPTSWATEMPAQVPLNEETLARGQDRYRIFCTPCHGEAGEENGGVVPRRAAAIGNAWTVASFHTERARGYAIGQIYDVIKNGYNTMPAYAAQIPTEDRWAIAAYVRALQVSYEMPLAQVPAEVRQAQGWR